MLDIVFIMLIFFIVTTTFIKETGVEVNRPNASTAVADERGNILIAITENNEIYIDKRLIDLRAVRNNVERLKAENPEGSVIIQADQNSKTGLLVETMDQVRNCWSSKCLNCSRKRLKEFIFYIWWSISILPFIYFYVYANQTR